MKITNELITIPLASLAELDKRDRSTMTAREVAVLAKIDKPWIDYAYTANGYHIGARQHAGEPVQTIASKLIDGQWANPMPALQVNGKAIELVWTIIDHVTIIGRN